MEEIKRVENTTDPYNPEHQTPEALALKNKMLKTFVYSAALVPQTFVFIKPQCASVVAEARKLGYTDDVFTVMRPQEKRAFGEQLARSRNNAHTGSGVRRSGRISTSFDLYDGLYLNSGVRSSLLLLESMQKMGMGEDDIISFGDWLNSKINENKETVRRYKEITSKTQRGENDYEDLSPREILQGLVDDLRDQFTSTELFKNIALMNEDESRVEDFLNMLFPGRVHIG